MRGADLGLVVGPEVAAEEGAAHGLRCAYQELQGFGHFDRGSEVDGRVQDAGGVAGVDDSGWRLGKEAGQAGGFVGKDVHGGGVGAHGSCVDPGANLLDGVVVDEVAGFKIVGRVKNDVRSCEQSVDVRGDQIGYVGAHDGLTVEPGDFTPGGFCLGHCLARILLVEQDLALQIAFFDEVTVDDGQGANPRSREQGCGCGSGGSAAHKRHMAAGESLLPLLTYPGIKHLAGVAVVSYCWGERFGCGFHPVWHNIRIAVHVLV